MTTIRQAHPADRDAFNAVLEPLEAFTKARGFVHSPETVTLVLEDGDTSHAGLIADVLWDWMHIRLHSVSDSLRGGGHGRALVRAAGAIAREKDCVGVWVDTYSFQSPGFYQQVGRMKRGAKCTFPYRDTS